MNDELMTLDITKEVDEVERLYRQRIKQRKPRTNVLNNIRGLKC